MLLALALYRLDRLRERAAPRPRPVVPRREPRLVGQAPPRLAAARASGALAATIAAAPRSS